MSEATEKYIREAGIEAYKQAMLNYEEVIARNKSQIDEYKKALGQAANYILLQDKIIRRHERIIKQFADMINPVVINMPPTTKYQPKMTLAPFIEAYQAVYADQDKDEV